MSDVRPLVLVICDSALLSPLLLVLCEEAGCSGCVAVDAESALLQYEQQARRPVLILVELMLGPETGFRTVRRLRESCACPLVILSGTGRASDEAWGLDVGATCVLPYPLNAEALRNLLPPQAACHEDEASR